MPYYSYLEIIKEEMSVRKIEDEFLEGCPKTLTSGNILY
jgi:hypothetical protein